MQLNLAFLNLPEPPSSRAPTNPPPAAWEQLDEAARYGTNYRPTFQIVQWVDRPGKSVRSRGQQ